MEQRGQHHCQRSSGFCYVKKKMLRSEHSIRRENLKKIPTQLVFWHNKPPPKKGIYLVNKLSNLNPSLVCIHSVWHTWDLNQHSFTENLAHPLLICTRIWKFLVWKIKYDEIDFLSKLNLIFTACVACKNLVQTRQKISFVELDFSN